MLYRKSFFILFLLFSLFSFSQVKVGQWLDHLSYYDANSVARVGDMVYVSNGSGLSTYNISDNEINKLTKINGLSDVGVTLLRKNDYNDNLLVIYSNTNIDVIKPNGDIINISDIKRKIITGKKVINEVFFNANIAYVSCGFGIIVFDTDKLEIKDTYYIGNGITTQEVYQVTKNDSAFFAATINGIYYGLVNANLTNYQNWKPLNIGLASGPYNSIVNFKGNVITNYSEYYKSGAYDKDTLYNLTNAGWQKYTINLNSVGSTNYKLYDYSKYNKLLIVDKNGLCDYAPSGSRTSYLTNYGFDYVKINDVFFDNSSFWIADRNYGLIKSGGAIWTPNEKININGPENNYVNDLDCKNGVLYNAPTDLGGAWNNQYQFPTLSSYSDYSWTRINHSTFDSIKDINCVAIDPNDNTHVSYGSWGKGVLEMRNNLLYKIHNTTNSTLKAAYGSSYDARVGGLDYDENSNLWAVASLNNKFLNVLMKNGTWINFDFSAISSVNQNAIMPINPNAGKVLVDKNNQVWIQLARGNGMVVFKPGSSYSQPNTSNAKVISMAKGSGALPSLDVRCMAEDNIGSIWVGSAKGISVFYNPENIFNGGNWDSQQILIDQDGQVKILLENDVITSISVDGVNRKWIGTESSGVYCLSADGQQEIYHFTKDNSPLYSNSIKDVVNDETTGDVFIATEEGIQSYRTSIIKGFEEYTNVHAYPNPVRPGYSGTIIITGLVDESEVKITDVSGNLVWSTKSQGGQVEWDMKSFSGTKAVNGVYIVYCTTASADKTATTKLLIVN